MKKGKLILVSILALLLVVSGCTSKTVPVVENEEFLDSGYVVNADWLKENIDKENLLILDARGPESYGKGHIPGAIAVTWQGFTDMSGAPGEDPNWGTVLEPMALSEKLSEFGITKDKEIVVYTTTTNGWGEDGRIVWMLRRAGFENTKILDGGIDFWDSKDDELASKLGKVVIIDTREKDEYEGATKHGEVRGGHIPGAINITFNEFLNNNGTLKTEKEIQTILDDNGITKDDEIATYCTAGIRSAHMQIILTMMGYDNAKNYDASIHAWAGNANLEMKK